MSSGRVDRRRFLGTSGTAAAASLLGVPRASGAPAAKARAVLIRRTDVLGTDSRVDGPVLHSMLNEAVCALLDEKDPAAAWRRIVKPDDIVGVKSNRWPALPTPPELETAIRDEVVKAGVPPASVGIDDQTVRSNPLFRRVTAVVNVRPMRTHDWAGLGTCLKNLMPFAPNPPDYHEDACANLGALWQLPQVAGKVRLNVLVLLTPQFHGVGPHSFAREWTWPYGGLLVSTQPVPADATGARIIEAKRRLHFAGERPLSPSPHHIAIASQRYGLGPSDPTEIDLVRLGSSAGALV